MTPHTKTYHRILDTYKLDEARLVSPFPPEMLTAIKQARRDKILNNTRELERERRGQILACTIRRRNKGPPAHILAKMTEEDTKNHSLTLLQLVFHSPYARHKPRILLARTKCLVFDANYCKATEHPFPAAIQDAESYIIFLRILINTIYPIS